jgi:surfeit locus 1 family protein
MSIGAGLGQWQLKRAEQKKTIDVKLHQRLAANILDGNAVDAVSLPHTALMSAALSNVEYRRMRLRGAFVKSWPIYLDNRPYEGRAGLHVLMPFRLSVSNHVVMVARGWIARDARDRSRVPDLITPSGQIVIEGIVRRSADRVMQLGDAPELAPGAIVQNMNLEKFSRVSGLPLQSYLIDQTSDTGDALVRDWPLPSSGIERHLGYAFQWYALTLMAAIFFILTGFRREQSGSPTKFD